LLKTRVAMKFVDDDDDDDDDDNDDDDDDDELCLHFRGLFT